MADLVPSTLIFGVDNRFQLQMAERRLLVDGQAVAIGARALDLLGVLASQPNHLITKSELLDRVWSGLVVEEGNLHVQVSTLRKLLGGDVIATVPGRGYRFAAPLSGPAGAPAPPSVQRPLAAAGPPGPRLIGRADDFVQLQAALEGAQLVTLAGIAGVGKTSLARQAFASRAGRKGWVDLATVLPGQALDDTVLRALGTQLDGTNVPAQLLRAVGNEPLLLVLDNAEHVVDAVADLVSLLRAAPMLRLLVTSQVPLALEAEHVQRLEPLALTAPDDVVDADDIGDGALALLVQRIVAADRRFRVAPPLLPTLHAICAQLDGLPLALEMAAARVPTLGVQGVHDALAARFTVLTLHRRDVAARHRTLHDAVEWSYRLLDPAAQRLLRALGVFVGGFTVDLAVGLCTGSIASEGDARWDVVDGLALLVDRSLVAVSASEPPRYRLLDTLRAFAMEQVALATAPGETAKELKRAHALALLELLTSYKVGDVAAATRCAAEMANARAALLWAVQVGDLGLAAGLSAKATMANTYSLWRHEAASALIGLEPTMRAAPAGAVPASELCEWWAELARALLIRGDPRAAQVGEEAYLLRRPLGHADLTLHDACVWVRSLKSRGADMDRAIAALDAAWRAVPQPGPDGAMMRHQALAHAAMKAGDQPAALLHFEAQLAVAECHGLTNSAYSAESNVVGRLFMVGRVDEAAARGQALLQRLPDDNGNLPWALGIVVGGLVRSDRLDEARALAPRAWSAFDRFNVPMVLLPLALLAARHHRGDDAARLLGHALEAFLRRDIQLANQDRGDLEMAQAMLLSALGDTRLALMLREGRQLDDGAARRLLLGG